MSFELIALCFALVFLCVGLAALFLRAFYRKSFIEALILKGTASACFIALGAITAFSGEPSTTSMLVFIGLCLGIIGDEVIALCQVLPKHDTLTFIGGGSFFLVGHVLYIVALFMLGDISWLALIVAFLVATTVSAAYTRRKGSLSPKMKTTLTLYLAAVAFMAATAIGAFFGRFTLGAGLFAAGGLLFTASDNILFAYKYGEKPRFIQNILLHVFYYAAQILIAWSMAFI